LGAMRKRIFSRSKQSEMLIAVCRSRIQLMPPTRRRKPAPKDLRETGTALWRKLLGEYQLNAAEESMLHQLCATMDEIADLKAALAASKPMVKGSKGQPRPNPLLASLVTHRKLADQLVTALALPIEGEVVGRRRCAQAKQAADARWRKTKSGPRIHAVAAMQKGGA
jgi:hypothetical protein